MKFFSWLIISILIPFNVFGEITINKAGWHLVSPGSITDLESLFDSQPNIHSIWGWNGSDWSVKFRTKPSNVPSAWQTLTSLEANQGYWIRTTGVLTIVEGDQNNINNFIEYNITNRFGWHLLGSSLEIDVVQFFHASLPMGGNVWTWNNSNWQIYTKRDLGERNQFNGIYNTSFENLRNIKPHQGFWVGFGEFRSILQVSGGAFHTCGLLSNGSIKCWGDGDSGELGNGSNSDQMTPVFVYGIDNAIQISAAGGFTCALLSNSSIKCWGAGYRGQLGDGNLSAQNTPVTVSGIDSAVQVAGGTTHNCALLSNGTVQCWGESDLGQLGTGIDYGKNTWSTTPVMVNDISTAIQISAGYSHTCTLLSDGSVKCWGNGAGGQLGNGDDSYQVAPVTVSGISTAIQVESKDYHTCALLSNGTVSCWGRGSSGQLGDGNLSTQNTPVTVNSINNATQIAVGSDYTCALLSGGTVTCWGENTHGQLGNGNTSNQAVPVDVSNIDNAVQLTTGYDHTCALLSNETIKCWGRGNYGQLGNDSTSNQAVPITVIGIP